MKKITSENLLLVVGIAFFTGLFALLLSISGPQGKRSDTWQLSRQKNDERIENKEEWSSCPGNNCF